MEEHNSSGSDTGETPENAAELKPEAKKGGIVSHLRRRWWFWLLAAILIGGTAGLVFFRPAFLGMGPDKRSAMQRPQPVMAAAVKKADVDVYLKGLGTVIPVNTVTVRSQVSGQLMRVHFKEGQYVKEGVLLAEIDPRPFQVQLMQAEGQLAKDEALLKNAENDLVRYKQLLAQDSIAEQQVTTQEALVLQYRGAVKTDRGQIANAKLQLTYSRITAPITGRIGLRLVDPGNMIQANDTNGIAVITQLQPVTVVFSVPQDNLAVIMKKLQTAEPLPVYAYNQEGKTLLSKGTLLAVDNQIDTTTGTVKLKARFENKDNELFANQFVNASMKVDTMTAATVIPTAAVQRGSIGTFAYVVKQDKSVTVRPLLLGPAEGDNVAVTSGLSDGEMVVVVGGDKLREGTKVEIVTEESAGALRQGKKPMREGGRREKPQNKDK